MRLIRSVNDLPSSGREAAELPVRFYTIPCGAPACPIGEALLATTTSRPPLEPHAAASTASGPGARGWLGCPSVWLRAWTEAIALRYESGVESVEEAEVRQ